MALILLTFRHCSFWTRPDSLQLFCAALSLFLATGRPGMVPTVLIGVAFGVLWNLKATGALYSLSVIVLIARRMGARIAAGSVATGAAVAVAPFFLSNVSLANYLMWVGLSGRTGLMLSILRQNLEWAAYLCAPLLLVGRITRGPVDVDRQVAATLGLGILFVVIAASKPGAGPYHLIPFAPTIAYIAAARLGMSSRSTLPRLTGQAAVAWTIVLVIVVAAQAAQFVSTMAPRRTDGDIEEVRAFLASRAGIVEMAYGRTEAKSLIRPILTFRNNAYLIDQPAVREYQLQGLTFPAAAIEAVARCRVTYWLVPRNEEPFSGVNIYPSVAVEPLYPQELRAAFFSSHRLIESMKYYDVWKCVGKP
jgi:hypothetical protein